MYSCSEQYPRQDYSNLIDVNFPDF